MSIYRISIRVPPRESRFLAQDDTGRYYFTHNSCKALSFKSQEESQCIGRTLSYTTIYDETSKVDRHIRMFIPKPETSPGPTKTTAYPITT